jgi:hypothetical protein
MRGRHIFNNPTPKDRVEPTLTRENILEITHLPQPKALEIIQAAQREMAACR